MQGRGMPRPAEDPPLMSQAERPEEKHVLKETSREEKRTSTSLQERKKIEKKIEKEKKKRRRG